VVKDAQVALGRALEREAEAQRDLLAGNDEGAAEGFRETAELYRRSWELAPPDAYGRLAGMLKAAILAGEGRDEAAYVRRELGAAESPAAAWAGALAALVEGDDERARSAARRMGEGDAAFRRTAGAVEALAAKDADRYRDALRAIVNDFERRDRHLTGVAIADTALVLERLAEGRGIDARPDSDLVPQRGALPPGYRG
jgi:hypothetical protein